jgi:hypothetical protein
MAKKKKISRDEIRKLIERLALPKKIPFTDLAKHITGFSTPIFGLSWKPPEPEREIIRQLVVFLEDRRALYNPYNLETVRWVDESILKIREELTNRLQQLGEQSKAAPSLRAMRAACRQYLDKSELVENLYRYRTDIKRLGIENLDNLYRDLNFQSSLGELRTIFGIHVARLCAMYGIDLEGKLISILPPLEEA